MNRTIKQLADILGINKGDVNYYLGKPDAPKPADIRLKNRQEIRVYDEKTAIEYYNKCKSSRKNSRNIPADNKAGAS